MHDPPGRSKLAAAASVMANHFEARAQLQRSLQSPLVVENHIKDDEIRAYVQILGAETKELFGNVLRGTVATVASIALDRTVSERQVRNWCGEFEQVPPLLVLPQEVATYALASDPLLSADICERR